MSNATQSDRGGENRAQRVSTEALRRRLARLQTGPLTIGDAATLLPLSGTSHQARAQFLRRLEARGVVPAARRSLIHGDRYWTPAELGAVRRALDKAASR